MSAAVLNTMAIYLDYAATTPLDNNVLQKMLPYLTENFGNASSQHSFGRKAANAVVAARDSLADIMGCNANELYFTSGGTEADNWAVKGVCSALESKGKHIIISAIEHPAVIQSAEDIKRLGFKVTYVYPNKNGIVTPQSIAKAVCSDTVFCAVMHANNETGVIQPIEEISAILREKEIFYFCDCVQTAGMLPLPIKYADGISLSAHKFYGPKGAGLLYLKSGSPICRLLSGGHQERGLRGGTTNVAAAVGLSQAYISAYSDFSTNFDKIKKLRNTFVAAVFNQISGVSLVGENAERLPGHANLLFEGCEGDKLVLALDGLGVACSTGAACSSGAVKVSPVLTAMGLSEEQAKSAVRFTFGKNSTEDDAIKAASILKTAVNLARLSNN